MINCGYHRPLLDNLTVLKYNNDKTNKIKKGEFMSVEVLLNHIKNAENEYKVFMGIDSFPTYKIQFKEASVAVAKTNGFESAATAFYKPDSSTHILQVCTNLLMTKELLFHEFTHILDSEIYAKGNKIRYFGLSGFTEYHASQVELMKALGKDSVANRSPFSTETIIDAFSGIRSVHQYFLEKQQFAIDLFSTNGFPANLVILKTAVGVLFNYFGLRSICEMFATNYFEEENNETFLQFIPQSIFNRLNNEMHGWLGIEKIEACMEAYIEIMMGLINKYNLS